MNKMDRLSEYLPLLAERFGSQRLRRTAELFLAVPFVVTVIVMGLYLMLWRTNPLIHFIHMLWVLGFWMAGTLGIFAFIIPVRLNLGFPFGILAFASMAIILAIYFTPLSRFTTVFSGLAGLILPAVIGLLNVLISWILILRFRNKIT
jgi:hypothetical protein